LTVTRDETSAFAPAGTDERNPALDGLRGLAVLLVTAAHAGIPVLRYGGVVGVTLFFVLSGYLITTLLLDERSLRHFYVRRALRLLPALVTVLVGGTALALAFGFDPADTFFAAGATLFYVNNFSPWFDRPMGPFANLWSLSMEEQFYLLWPLVLLLVGRARSRALLVATVAAAAVSLGARFAGPVTTREGYRAAAELPHFNAWALLAGCALALAMAQGWWPRLSAAAPGAALAVVFLAASPMGLVTGLREDASGTAYVLRLAAGPVAAAAAVVLLCHAAGRGRTWSPLRHPALLFFGSISYALYLWHGVFDHVFGERWGREGMPGLVVGSASAALAIGVATLSRRYVEAPFLRRKPPR
jgi:peptidoglycan/LPS O-acetylase OafA/YrhL